MPFFSRKKRQFNPPLAKGHASQSAQQRRPVCTWSAHGFVGQSPLPFPRYAHTLTATATSAGELFLFGGYVHGYASSDLYEFSTRDFSRTLLQTSGEVPTPRAAHGAALIGTTLLICGGTAHFGDQYMLNHDTLYLLNLVSREWTRVVVNGPGPGRRYYPTTTVVGSKLFVFGGQIGGKIINDMWTLDLNFLNSQPVWESYYEPTPGNEKPLPRTAHVTVTTEDCIIIFGGAHDQHYYNDTWSFDISTRKWTELQCTGSIPSSRSGHAAALVDDVMYVFGGFSADDGYLDDLYALQLSTQRWFKFDNAEPSPHRRSHHAMASDGTRVFVLGGSSECARVDEIYLIYVFDTKDIKYPEPEPDAANPNEKPTQLARELSPTQGQPQNRKSSSSEAPGASRLQNATPAVSGRHASLQITHERNRGLNGRPLELTGINSKPRRFPEDNVSEGTTEYHGKFATLHSSSEGEVTRFELERQLSVSLAAQAERDERIARLTDELALKSALLEQAEADAAEGKRHARLELREHADDRRLMRTSPVKQRDVEPVDVQARLRDMQAKLDDLLLSRDQQIGQYEKELANMRAKLEANESELKAVRLRLMDAEDGWAKSEAKADKLHTVTVASLVDLNEDRDMYDPKEDMQVTEAGLVVSLKWNEKSIEEMECRNEG